MNLIKFYFLLAFVSCASAGSSLLRLEDRTLLIDPDGRGLIYPYNYYKCKYPNRPIFKKCKLVRSTKIYDLGNETTRQKLIGMGFECFSPMRFRY